MTRQVSISARLVDDLGQEKTLLADRRQAERIGRESPIQREERRKAGPTSRPCGFDLLSQAESADDGLIAATILVAEIGQHAGSLADHLEQTPPGGVILFVCPHVIVQFIDTSRQQRDLDFRRTGVVLLTAILVNDFQLAVLGYRHLEPRPLRRVIHPATYDSYPLTSGYGSSRRDECKGK